MDLYLLIHEHKYGQSFYLVKSHKDVRKMREEYLADCCAIDYEPDKDETLSVEFIDHITTVEEET